MQFVHESVRLACDANRAFRFLTRPEMLEKWVSGECRVDLRVGGAYGVKADLGPDGPAFDTQGSEICQYEREKTLEVSWRDSLHTGASYNLLVRFMPCRSDTEFCTELHLMFKHQDRMLEQDEFDVYSKLFGGLFERLRQHVNKDWVIRDADLSLSWLRGSSF